MEEDLNALINRTELAAQRAEASDFQETAEALRAVATTLRKSDSGNSNDSRLKH